MIDVNAWIGGYPFRHVPHPEPAILARVLERERLTGAWVGHLPSAFWRDPTPGNAELYASLEPHRDVLAPAPCIRPDWPHWERQLRDAADRGAPAVRAYPMQWGMGPGDAALRKLGGACHAAGMAMLLTVRFEDLRQRHGLDVASDLTAAHVRALMRAPDAPCVVVGHAGRELIEEIVWSLTEMERERLWFDFSCVWGPPEDHLALLFRTIGANRFTYGTGWPLRLAQAPAANLALLPDDLREASITDAATIVGHARALGGNSRA
jgi:predicted TIM-barrel fold metal-dependent hydrolase